MSTRLSAVVATALVVAVLAFVAGDVARVFASRVHAAVSALRR